MKTLTKKDSGIVFLLALFAPQIIGGLVLYVFCLFFPSAEVAQKSVLYTYLAALIPQLCFALIFLIFTKTKRIEYKTIFANSGKPTLKNCLIVVAMSLILFCSFYYFIDLIETFFVNIGINTSKFGATILNDTPIRFILNIVFMAILPAIFEELIYRQLIFSGLRQSGKWYAVFVSSAMFALMHLNLLQFVYPFVMGMVFALVFDKTNCIYYTSIMHFCNNFLVLVVDYFNGIYIFNLTYSLNAISIILILLAAIVGLLLIWLLIKKVLCPARTEELSQKKQCEFSVELLLSIVVSIAFWVIALVTTLKG